jgi:hypothetical protein
MTTGLSPELSGVAQPLMHWGEHQASDSATAKDQNTAPPSLVMLRHWLGRVYYRVRTRPTQEEC